MEHLHLIVSEYFHKVLLPFNWICNLFLEWLMSGLLHTTTAMEADGVMAHADAYGKKTSEWKK